jgi:ankyrin repeat protein
MTSFRLALSEIPKQIAAYVSPRSLNQESATKAGLKKVNADGTTDLALASARGDHEEVQKLVTGGADVEDVTETDGTTALFNAAMNGHDAIVNL